MFATEDGTPSRFVRLPACRFSSQACLRRVDLEITPLLPCRGHMPHPGWATAFAGRNEPSRSSQHGMIVTPGDTALGNKISANVVILL
ncbi:hypothetical protein KCP78_21015 [Salmonella enterica subsp. enterica]|nr:hypothetical protein KCP78_21015 [Salmonella enterica subsp. enterica]